MMPPSRPTRRAFVASALAAATLLPDPRRAAAQARRSVMDSAGRRVELPAKVTRVFPAGPPATILLFALAPDTLVGWTTDLGHAEREYVPARYATLPTLGRLTGRGNTANVEAVLATKPDLIFDYGAINPTFASLADRVQAQTGVPYMLVDGAFDAIPEAFALLGDVVGEPARATELGSYARGLLTDLKARIDPIPRARRPRVYYARGPKGLETGLGGSINVESIERVGATNVAAETMSGGLTTVSMEQVLRWNPDTVVTIDATFHREVWSDPLWQGVDAVRAKRVYLAPVLPFGWVDLPPSVNRLIGLRWLASQFYPDVFPEDLRPIVRDFFTSFYHQAPTEAQIDRLLPRA